LKRKNTFTTSIHVKPRFESIVYPK
jgi:hypothetical protein